jgi:hypothetical protein
LAKSVRDLVSSANGDTAAYVSVVKGYPSAATLSGCGSRKFATVAAFIDERDATSVPVVGAANVRWAPSSPARLSDATCSPNWIAEGVSVTESIERLPMSCGPTDFQIWLVFSARGLLTTFEPSSARRAT